MMTYPTFRATNYLPNCSSQIVFRFLSNPFSGTLQRLRNVFVLIFQFFALNKDTLMSLVELPTLEVPGGGATSGLRTARSQVSGSHREMWEDAKKEIDAHISGTSDSSKSWR